MPVRRKAAVAESPVVEVLPARVLPGEAKVDEAAVDRAVEEINRLYTAKGLETARAIGEYVLSTFFAGDPESFRTKGRKHVSFRQLAQRDDLFPSYSWIWKAVSVVDQLRLLPEDIAAALPMSHHTLLLPVRDQEAKVDLAKRAAEEHLNREKFAKEVSRVRAREKKKSGVGRPALPAFAKGLARLAKAVELATSDEPTSEDFAHYEPADARTLLEELDGQISALQALKKQVNAALAAWERETGEKPRSGARKTR